MKKIILTLSAMVMSVGLFAFSAGIKGDLGASNHILKSGDTEYDTSFKLAGRVGGAFAIPITDMFSFEPEIMFHIGNGFIMKESGIEVKISYNTLELPLMFKGKFELGPGKFAVGLGPQFSLLVGDIKTALSYGGTTSTDTATAKDMNMNTFAVGFAAGIEYGMPIGPGDLVLGVRYQMDLTNLVKEGSDSQRSMQIFPSLAYLYRF